LLVFLNSAKLNGMELRALNENDAAKYWNLRLKSLQAEPLAFGKAAEEHQATTVEAMGMRLREMAPDFTLGAFEQGELIGMATYIREKGLKERHKGRIYGVYVSGPHRGKGIGAKLIAELLQRATVETELEQILLAVATGQESACRLYRKFGFEAFGIEPRALKVGTEYVDEEHMILRVR
jgi:ribosomal protein S18 acetylase RimI-like enzyme